MRVGCQPRVRGGPSPRLPVLGLEEGLGAGTCDKAGAKFGVEESTSHEVGSVEFWIWGSHSLRLALEKEPCQKI